MILINPVAPNRMGMISRYTDATLPMGIGTLAGYLLAKGRQAKIIDELSGPMRLSDVNSHIKQLSKPYIFGISCLTINISRGYEIARMLKREYPDAKVILGGIHATALPEEALAKGNIVDIVVRGEGEETLLLLYDTIKNNRNYSDIAGISFKENGKIIHNPARPLIEDLNTIPRFPYELFADKYSGLGHLMTSRGCPYDCIFCSQRLISGKRYRFASCESVIETIDLLINKYNQRNLGFYDDNFLVNKKRVRSLCELIIQKGFNLRAAFSCQTRADNVDRETLAYLKDAGFAHIGLGIETGSERLMKILNKRETVKVNIEAVKMIKEMGFGTSGFFLFGIPTETQRERFQTYRLAKKMRLDYAKFNNIVPYPKTRLWEIAQKEGTLNIAKDWENFNSVEGVVKGVFSKAKLPYIPINTTEKQLRRDMVRSNFYFYLAHLSSLFVSKQNKSDWFSLSERWYFNPKELFYLFILLLKVALNCVIVFDVKWFIEELRDR